MFVQNYHNNTTFFPLADLSERRSCLCANTQFIRGHLCLLLTINTYANVGWHSFYLKEPLRLLRCVITLRMSISSVQLSAQFQAPFKYAAVLVMQKCKILTCHKTTTVQINMAFGIRHTTATTTTTTTPLADIHLIQLYGRISMKGTIFVAIIFRTTTANNNNSTSAHK